MVLEGTVKYLVATIILFFAMFSGWLFSAKYLEPVILRVFAPETHDRYLDIWFSIFTIIEILIVIIYAVYVYKTYKSKTNLTKPSN